MNAPTVSPSAAAAVDPATAPPPVEHRLHDRVAVVTGAAAGIGQAYAWRLAAEGAHLAIADIQPADETADGIEQAGRDAFVQRCDITDPDEVQAFAAAVTDRFGGVDILVNNAGVYPHVPLEETTFDDWRRVMAINLDGSFLMAQALAPALRTSGRGRIINIASSEPWMVSPNATAYLSSKMGVVGLTRALATELADDGVTVNAVAPGLTGSAGDSPRTTVEDMLPDLFDVLPPMQAIKRSGTAYDLVGVVAFLASDDARFLTAQTLVVDGGMIRL